jgi:hypothetical protein
VHVARLLPPSPGATPGTERGYEPALAIVKDRIIVGNQPGIVIKLVDQLLDGRLVPRVAGDELEIVGPVVGVGNAAPRLSPRPNTAADPESRARSMLTAVNALLAGVRTARVRFDLADTQASLEIEIDAPRLVPLESRPSQGR